MTPRRPDRPLILGAIILLLVLLVFFLVTRCQPGYFSAFAPTL